MALTAKQEKFVQELVKGKSQRQAYLSAGYSDQKGNDDAVDRRASELFANSKVKGRYECLYSKVIKNAEKKVQWSFDDSLKGLIDIISKTTNQEDFKTAIQAYKELNSMNGYNAKNINLDASVTTYEDKLKEVSGEEF